MSALPPDSSSPSQVEVVALGLPQFLLERLQAGAGPEFDVIRPVSDAAEFRARLEAGCVAGIVAIDTLYGQPRAQPLHWLREQGLRDFVVIVLVGAFEDPAEDLCELGVDVIAPLSRPGRLLLHDLQRELRRLNAQRDHETLLAAVHSAPCGITIADVSQPDLPLVFVNQAFERLTGYPITEALGRNCRFLQDGHSDQPGVAEIRQALAEGRTARVQLRNQRRDGSSFLNELHLAPFHDGTGRLTHYIGVQLDVTAREEAMERLQESEERYHAIANAVPIKLCQLNDMLETVFANEAWRDYAPQPDRKPLVDVVGLIAAEAREQAVAELRQALSSGRPTMLEVPLLHPVGGEYLHRLSFVPQASAQGEIVGLLGSVVDVSALRKQDERTSQKVRQLTLQSLMMRRLLARTPGDVEAVRQALAILAEMIEADDVLLVRLEGEQSLLTPVTEWNLEGWGGLAPTVRGLRLTQAFPFTAPRLLAGTATVAERAEMKLFRGEEAPQGIVLVPLSRGDAVQGLLLATKAGPLGTWAQVTIDDTQNLRALLASLLG
ncbi:MAG: PAS domain-containing protein [Verrucomicrobia bacterium]|nr:PAS domain-containing protein [Verrucomicrobiota bacterium]